MKNILIPAVAAMCLATCTAARAQHTGVWASDNAELLMTDSITLYFERLADDKIAVMAKIGSMAEEYTIFSKDTVIRGDIPAEFRICQPADNEIHVNSEKLIKVEDVETCPPYEMPTATDRSSIGERLKEWRLGVKASMDKTTGDIYVEANTNENMFVYMIDNGMYYLRAAKTANVNEGTLFYQNIRLMKNPNTKENTVYFAGNNLEIMQKRLEPDIQAFNPDACYFSPDGGIYWSYVSHTADRIVINGCGELYYVDRPSVSHDQMYEWIKPDKKK